MASISPSRRSRPPPAAIPNANGSSPMPIASSPTPTARFSLVLSITGRMNAAEFRRVLRDDGRLLVALPAPDDLIELRRETARPRPCAQHLETFAPEFQAHGPSPGHHRRRSGRRRRRRRPALHLSPPAKHSPWRRCASPSAWICCCFVPRNNMKVHAGPHKTRQHLAARPASRRRSPSSRPYSIPSRWPARTSPSHTAGLTTEQIWATPHGFGSVGFHLRHIAGSTARLMTYVTGAQLSPAEIWRPRPKRNPEQRVKCCSPPSTLHLKKPNPPPATWTPRRLTDPRTVGRKQLPTTVIGLLVHTAEHTQRHVGQAISAAKWARHL